MRSESVTSKSLEMSLPNMILPICRTELVKIMLVKLQKNMKRSGGLSFEKSRESDLPEWIYLDTNCV